MIAIISAAALLCVGALAAWFTLKKKKDEPIEEPVEPEIPIEEPIEEPIKEPVEEPIIEEEPVQPVEEPQPEPVEEPTEEEETAEDKLINMFNRLLSYFCIDRDTKTADYLWYIFTSAEKHKYLFNKENFPVVLDYWGDNEHENSAEIMCAWLFAMVLAEIMPLQREELYNGAYHYCCKGKNEPIYGWDFLSDPNVMRQIASVLYSVTRKAEVIPALRAEMGTTKIKYNNNINEIFFDLSKFMPAAPGPWIPAQSNRAEIPADNDHTVEVDSSIHEYISQYYKLDTRDAEKRQATIQAIADKEYNLPHLFGKPRTVDGVSHGKMTFNPVFGKHNIGIEIPDNGAIAKLCEAVGLPCSNNRKSLLNPQYGRRRPGQGNLDPSANPIEDQKALVNYAIEEGDGVTTGYYNNNGDYIKYDGTHIGDYKTYFQGQLYANSYPSGHSAYIWGVALALIEVMPDRAAQIMKAANQFAINRTIARYHWTSDTIQGRVIGSTLIPVLHAEENTKLDKLIDKAKTEYENIVKGITPKPEPEVVNVTLSYSMGGYGSCHVDAGEKQLCHCCNKECNKERHPGIVVSQKVDFTIEGAGVTTMDGKTSGTWEANTTYYLTCPMVAEGEEKIATITMKNKNGTRILYYKLSRNGTHDDGPYEG